MRGCWKAAMVNAEGVGSVKISAENEGHAYMSPFYPELVRTKGGTWL